MSVVKKCSCKHKYQDKRYGLDMRVMNALANKVIPTYRRTVCGTIH